MANEERATREGVVWPDGTVHFKAPVGEESREFVFRVPDLEDLARVDVDLPLLPVEEDEEDELTKDPTGGLKVILSDPKKSIRYMQRANKMLRLVSLRPKLVDANPGEEEEEGAVAVRALKSGDRIFIYLALTGLAGLTGESAAEIAPFVEVGGSS